MKTVFVPLGEKRMVLFQSLPLCGSHKASKFMALLSIDLKQFGCCSRTILKSPLIVRTFSATSPRKRVQDNLNFVINHVNSNPTNTNDFLVSFGVKVSGYLLKGRLVTALACLLSA